MDYRQMIDSMSPDTYRQLRTAVEIGRWPDGRQLTPEQRQNAMQAVIAWGEIHLPEEQRVGYIDAGSKQDQSCDAPQPLKWRD